MSPEIREGGGASLRTSVPYLILSDSSIFAILIFWFKLQLTSTLAINSLKEKQVILRNQQQVVPLITDLIIAHQPHYILHKPSII